MLQLKHNQSDKPSLWLVKPVYRFGGSDVDIDLGADQVLAEIHVNEDSLVLFILVPQSVWVNDVLGNSGQRLFAGDRLRIARHDFEIIDPKTLFSELQDPEALANIQPLAYSPLNLSRPLPGADVKAGERSEAPDSSLTELRYRLVARDDRSIRYEIRDKASVGRASECDIVIRRPRLSRNHAEFRLERGRVFLLDLGSSNGTLVNHRRIAQAEVFVGDHISFAGSHYILEVASSNDSRFVDASSMGVTEARTEDTADQNGDEAVEKNVPTVVARHPDRRRRIEESEASMDADPGPYATPVPNHIARNAERLHEPEEDGASYRAQSDQSRVGRFLFILFGLSLVVAGWYAAHTLV